MTQKERLDKLMEDRKKNQTDLLVAIYQDASEDERAGRNCVAYIEKKKGNFSKMINGERKFPVHYIPTIERELQTTFLYIVTGETNDCEGKYRPHGLEYIASRNEYDAFNELVREVDIYGDSIIHNRDEYGKNIVDYIRQYDSVEGWRFLIQNKYLRCKVENYGREYSKDDFYGFFDILLGHKEYELCLALFDPFQLCSRQFELYHLGNHFAKDDEFKKRMLTLMRESDALLQKREIDLEDNYHKPETTAERVTYIDPFLQIVMQEALQDVTQYEDALNRLLDYGIQHNNEYLDWLDENLPNDRKKMEICGQYGFVRTYGGYDIGNMLTYDTVDPDLPEMIRIKLQTLQAQKNQLLHPTEELKNTGKTIIKGNYIWRPSSHNQFEYETLRLCAEAGFDKVPRYYETREDLDRFDYMKGSTIGDAKNREQHFSQIMRFLGQFHETTMAGNGKIYVHGGIGDDNVILDKDGIKAVINWQNCREGDRYEDIVSLLLDWLHIGDLAWSRYEPETFGQVIVSGLSAYGADSEFCSQLIIRIQAELDRRMEKLRQEKDSYNYKSRYIYLRNAEIFLELYGEQIRSIREEI